MNRREFASLASLIPLQGIAKQQFAVIDKDKRAIIVVKSDLSRKEGMRTAKQARCCFKNHGLLEPILLFGKDVEVHFEDQHRFSEKFDGYEMEIVSDDKDFIREVIGRVELQDSEDCDVPIAAMGALQRESQNKKIRREVEYHDNA